MTAYPGKAGAFTDEPKTVAAEAKSKGHESFAMFLNQSIPRDAPCGYRPDWNTSSETVFKRVESHTGLEANKKAQVGVTYSSMVAKMSCGVGFAKKKWQTFEDQWKEKTS